MIVYVENFQTFAVFVSFYFSSLLCCSRIFCWCLTELFYLILLSQELWIWSLQGGYSFFYLLNCFWVKVNNFSNISLTWVISVFWCFWLSSNLFVSALTSMFPFILISMWSPKCMQLRIDTSYNIFLVYSLFSSQGSTKSIFVTFPRVLIISTMHTNSCFAD